MSDCSVVVETAPAWTREEEEEEEEEEEDEEDEGSPSGQLLRLIVRLWPVQSLVTL